MPIYEYLCEDCHKKSSFLLLRVSEVIDPYCESCGSKNLKKLISRISVPKSEEKRMESLMDPSIFSDLDENSPLLRTMSRNYPASNGHMTLRNTLIGMTNVLRKGIKDED